MKLYHAHVYFPADAIDLAKEISRNLMSEVPGLFLAGIAKRPVGPHPLPMIEFHLTEDEKPLLLQALKKETRIESTLVHEDTGDDAYDHSDGAEWVGNKLQLDFGFFDLIKRDPSKMIHSPKK